MARTRAGERSKPLAGQLVLLHFWASWCLASARDYPYWVKAQERFAAQGLTLLGVSSDLNHNIGPDAVQAAIPC